jgi:hypothetical protein
MFGLQNDGALVFERFNIVPFPLCRHSSGFGGNRLRDGGTR